MALYDFTVITTWVENLVIATGKLQGVYKQRTTHGRKALSALGL